MVQVTNDFSRGVALLKTKLYMSDPWWNSKYIGGYVNRKSEI